MRRSCIAKCASPARVECLDQFEQPAKVFYGDLATGKCWIECPSPFAFQRDDGVCYDCGGTGYSDSGVGVRIVYGGAIYTDVGYG